MFSSLSGRSLRRVDPTGVTTPSVSPAGRGRRLVPLPERGDIGAQAVSKREQHPRIHPTVRERARQLRSSLTPAEVVLWQHLRLHQLGGFKFRRQHPIGRFIVDFYCAEHKLAVELDGDSHAQQVEYDAARTKWLEQHGYRIVRFSNQDVMNSVEAVVAEIARQCGLTLAQG